MQRKHKSTAPDPLRHQCATTEPFVVALHCRVGTKHICKPKAGETFVISGGAGSVGSICGQLAKAYGARVVGIAGSDDKVRALSVDHDAFSCYAH